MRKYTEPVALYDAAVAPDTVYQSWLPSALPGAFPVYHWVDCKGFENLRLLAIGDGDFKVFVYAFPEDAPAAGAPDPTYLERQEFDAVVVDAPPPLLRKGVCQSIDLCGAEACGVEMVIPPGVNGEATYVSLRAYLR